jgi:hypothetical protein
MHQYAKVLVYEDGVAIVVEVVGADGRRTPRRYPMDALPGRSTIRPRPDTDLGLEL